LTRKTACFQAVFDVVPHISRDFMIHLPRSFVQSDCWNDSTRWVILPGTTSHDLWPFILTSEELSVSSKSPVQMNDQETKTIILVSYPKIILLYPTFIASILAAILAYFFQIDNDHNQTIAIVFLTLMTVNMVVLAFDFPRTTSLIVFFLIVTLGMGLLLISIYFPELLPSVTSMLKKINPRANSTFYVCFATMLGLIYVGVFINIRFDYWEVRPNELLHHHGFLSSLERYSAPNLRISKEIDDVFEYMLLRCGRLILHPSNEPRAFVLDNVLGIDKKEAAITKMLGALQVQIRDERTAAN
jgi:hypothetical protein